MSETMVVGGYGFEVLGREFRDSGFGFLGFKVLGLRFLGFGVLGFGI